MRAQAEKVRLGDPLDPASTMGALVDRTHADRVMSFIEGGKQSARLICGGDRRRELGSDAYVAPTVFADVAPGDPLAQDEVFGPVLAIQTFEDEAEAVQLANNTVYGLAASVWTRDLSRALSVSEALVAGTVSVNTVDALSTYTPFGGMKQSGYGRDLSLHSFDKYSALKTTWIKY